MPAIIGEPLRRAIDQTDKRAEQSSRLAATPVDLVRWLRLPCAPVLKSPRMFRDAEEWSTDHSGAQANFASKRA